MKSNISFTNIVEVEVGSYDPGFSGCRRTYKKLHSFLKKQGIEPIRGPFSNAHSHGVYNALFTPEDAQKIQEFLKG